tara:strand:- start:262 stop:747 length:486 start_codon:yes stop_codon:yes gene_type:complete
VDELMKLLAKKVVKKLLKKKIKISIAESCTGGLLSSSITSVSGSSKIFNFGLVTYSNQSKNKILNVSKKTLSKYGAVSKETCKAMLENVNKLGKNNLSISITGIAGPKGGSIKKPVGLVFIGIKKNNNFIIKKYLFNNKGRFFIQMRAVNKSLQLILGFLK